MIEKILDFLKGIIIGIANVIPGFSGGIMAVAFNVYDKLISAVSNIFFHPLKAIKSIWSLALGIGMGIILTIIGISVLLNKFPVPTILFFTGLIVGSIPTIYDKVKEKSHSVYHYGALFLGVLIIVGIPLITKDNAPVIVSTIDYRIIITLFGIGIIAAATMVIPGISGSLILLAIGYYQFIIDFVMDFLKSIIHLNFISFKNNFVLVIALGLGLVAGFLALSKLIEKLIAKYPKLFYMAILGLLIASPFAIIYQMYQTYQTRIYDALIISWVIGIIFLIVGALAADYLARLEKKKECNHKNKTIIDD